MMFYILIEILKPFKKNNDFSTYRSRDLNQDQE